MTEEYKSYLKSDKWKEIRSTLFKMRGKKCENCSRTKALHIHHLTYDRIFNERLDDLQILCKDCHKRKHVKPKLTLAQKVLKKKRAAKSKQKIKYKPLKH